MDLVRRKKLRELLKEKKVGVFIFWRSEELVMSLGYQPLWGISVCLFPFEGEPILYIPELEPRDRLPSDVIVKIFPWGILDCSDPWAVLYGMMKSDIKSLGIGLLPVSFVKEIGQSSPPQMIGENPPLPSNMKFEFSKLTEGGFIDIEVDILKQYNVKTELEIGRIILVNKVAEVGVRSFYDNLIPGKKEIEIASIVESAIQNLVDDKEIYFAKAWPLIMSGINSAHGGTFNRSTAKKIQEGEFVMMEMAICVNGYWADITRTGSVQYTTNLEHLKIFQTVYDAQQIAIEGLHSGKTTESIDSAVRTYIDKKGYSKYFNHALGHPVGFRYHDYGPVIAPGSKGLLHEGMIYTIEPGIYIPEVGAGVRIEDNVLITKNGYKILSDFKKTLH